MPVIVSGGMDGTVRVWDARPGEAWSEPLTGHINGVSGVAVGQVDGLSVIVSGGWDRTVRVWDARSRVHCRIEADAESYGVVCTPEGLIVAAATLGLVAFQLSTVAGLGLLRHQATSSCRGRQAAGADLVQRSSPTVYPLRLLHPEFRSRWAYDVA